MIVFKRGHWWEIGIGTDRLMIVIGRNFYRNLIGIDIGWGRQPDPSPMMSRYRRTCFIRLPR